MVSPTVLVDMGGGGAERYLNSTFSRANHCNQQHQYKTHIDIWNITTLTGKEIELIEEARQYQLDMVGISLKKRKDKGILSLNNDWQLFYLDVDPSICTQAGVAILLLSHLVDAVLKWEPISDRVSLIRLQLKKINLTII